MSDFNFPPASSVGDGQPNAEGPSPTPPEGEVTRETPSVDAGPAGDTQQFPTHQGPAQPGPQGPAQPTYFPHAAQPQPQGPPPQGPPPGYPMHGYPPPAYPSQPGWGTHDWHAPAWPQPGAGGSGWGSGPPTQQWGAPPAGGHHAPKKGKFPVVAVALSASMAALLAGLGIGHAVWHQSAASSQPPSNNPGGFQVPGNNNGNGLFGPSGNGSSGSSNSGNSGNSAAANAVAAKVDPALVDINTSLSYQGGEAAGTGIVLTSSGIVLTNNHVINGATTVSATDIGNGKTYTADVIGYDRSHDIAILQLRDASHLHTASLGDSSAVKTGQSIIGIGNAGGAGGTPSVVTGSVTALNRNITASDQGGGDSEQLNGLIQVNANIQPGDSGGPLVNSDGQVVGMDTAASDGFSFQSSQTEGFAIPINNAINIGRQIESHQTTSSIHIGQTAFIGVEVQAPGSQSQNGFGFGSGSQNQGGPSSGATVVGVVSGSPADQVGLQDGDTITSVNGKTVDSPTTLTNLLLNYHPGDSVQLGWVDGSGNQQTGNVHLAIGPAE